MCCNGIQRLQSSQRVWHPHVPLRNVQTCMDVPPAEAMKKAEAVDVDLISSALRLSTSTSEFGRQGLGSVFKFGVTPSILPLLNLQL